MANRRLSTFASALLAVVSIGFLGALGYFFVRPGGPTNEAPPTRDPNPIVVENRKHGTQDWALSGSPDAVRGYASPITVKAGAPVSFYVSTKAKDFRIDVFRMGWYGGDGARLVWSRSGVPGAEQSAPFIDNNPKSYMVEARWRPSLRVPTGTDWVSGEYLARLTAAGGSSYVPFVVRDDAGSRFLAIAPVTTWEAYNLWGGRSLYKHQVGGLADSTLRSRIVSFDRPFDLNGAHRFLQYDYPMIRFLEQRGDDVTYATNIDEDLRGKLLLKHAAVLMIGHDEYWSTAIRNALGSARDSGVNLAFFAANDGYRKIRFTASATGPDRRMAHYKVTKEDPLFRRSPGQVASQWRFGPTNRPENELVGLMYACDPVEADLVIGDTSDWVFKNTGFRRGDRVRGLIGHEYDRDWTNGFAQTSPPGLRILTRSPVVCNGKDDVSESSIYIASSGAGVFDAGTIQWNWGLDSFGSEPFGGSPGRLDHRDVKDLSSGPAVADEKLKRLTANLLDAFSRGPLVRTHKKP